MLFISEEILVKFSTSIRCMSLKQHLSTFCCGRQVGPLRQDKYHHVATAMQASKGVSSRLKKGL